ncbi:MAG: hypothetical protein WCJ56_07640 [bacterium]
MVEEKEQKSGEKKRLNFGWLELVTLGYLLFALSLVISPAVYNASQARPASICVEKQKKIVHDLITSINDKDGLLPEASSWSAGLKDYTPKDFKCPAVNTPEGTIDYGFNTVMDHRWIAHISKPEKAPLTYDERDERPDYRHMSHLVISFLDEHVEIVSQPEAEAYLNADPFDNAPEGEKSGE